MASTAQASANMGTPPREQTVSTSSRVPLALHISPTPARFWWVPVLLSPCKGHSFGEFANGLEMTTMLGWLPPLTRLR